MWFRFKDKGLLDCTTKKVAEKSSFPGKKYSCCYFPYSYPYRVGARPAFYTALQAEAFSEPSVPSNWVDLHTTGGWSIVLGVVCSVVVIGGVGLPWAVRNRFPRVWVLGSVTFGGLGDHLSSSRCRGSLSDSDSKYVVPFIMMP